MIDTIYVDYLDAGALPIYEPPAPTQGSYYLTEDGSICGTGQRRVILPTFEIRNFEEVIQSFVRALDEVSEALGTLIFSLRAVFTLDNEQFVVAGLGFVSGRLPAASALEGVAPEEILLRLATGLNGCDSASLPPALREALARELARRAEVEARRLADAEAEARARVLLEAHLTQDQLAEWQETGVFHVELRDGRRFRFIKRYGHNVVLVEGGLCTVEYCIISTMRIPLCDQILAQKVMLEAVPDEFFRIANFYRPPTPTAEPPPLPLFAELNALRVQV